MSATRSAVLLSIFVAAWVLPATASADAADARVLVFSSTSAFRHTSIDVGVETISSLGECAGFAVDRTESATDFNDANLAAYAAVVWLNTTGDVLDETEQAAFESYIQAGGGYVGVHSASDTEYDWPWYGELLGNGAWFRSHPSQQQATLRVEDPTHISTMHYPSSFQLLEEWYSFRADPSSAVNVLLAIDETTYNPSHAMGESHPISWNHEFDGGRSWYTAIGHRAETYADENYRNHLRGGILWAAGLDPDSAPCGDADQDGAITAVDALISLGVAIGERTCADCVCDVDANGTKSATDALAVLRVVIGLDANLQCPSCLC